MTGQFLRTPAGRAHGSAAMQVSRRLAGLLAHGLMRLTVTGREYLPAGGTLLAVNHASYLDGPLVFGMLPRPGRFFVKAEAFTGLLGWYLPQIGQIAVRREVPQRAPLLAALATLAEGGIVGVFPEGTRGTGGDLGQFRPGIAYLAVRSGCPVVPVACLGTERVLARGRRVPRVRQPVTVAFGRPVGVAEASPVATKANVAGTAERIRLLLADHVCVAATRLGAPPLAPAAPGGPGGPDR